MSPTRKLRKRSLSVGARKARYAVPRSDHSGDACQVTDPRPLGCTSLSAVPDMTFSVAMRSRRAPPTTVHCGAACTVTWSKPAAVVCTPPARVVGRPHVDKAGLVGRAFDAAAFAAGDQRRAAPHPDQSALPPAASLGTRCSCVRLSLARPAATAENDWL